MDVPSITVAYGDGVGPEVMEATLRILQEAGAQLKIDTIEIGEQVFKRGSQTGIPADAWESLRRTGILLKGPLLFLADGQLENFTQALIEYLGDRLIIFEPDHGPMTELMEKNQADPSAMIMAAIRMLEHVGQNILAEKIQHALAHAKDDGCSAEAMGTMDFAEAVMERLGK